MHISEWICGTTHTRHRHKRMLADEFHAPFVTISCGERLAHIYNGLLFSAQWCMPHGVHVPVVAKEMHFLGCGSSAQNADSQECHTLVQAWCRRVSGSWVHHAAHHAATLPAWACGSGGETRSRQLWLRHAGGASSRGSGQAVRAVRKGLQPAVPWGRVGSRLHPYRQGTMPGQGARSSRMHIEELGQDSMARSWFEVVSLQHPTVYGRCAERR